MEIKNNPICRLHSCEMPYREFTSRAGNFVKGYFCPQKQENGLNCESHQFIYDRKTYKKVPPLIDDQQYQTLLKGLREIYAIVKEIKEKI